MQAVILAAGVSSRFWPINKRHKCLFPIMGRPLICYTLENLKKSGIKEVVIVQKESRDVENTLKDCPMPRGLKIKYAIQRNSCGTGDALKSAEKHLNDRFLVLYGDDFYSRDVLKSCQNKFPSLLVREVENPECFGVVVEENGFVKAIIEKPKKAPSRLVNAGGYFIPKTVLSGKIEKSERGEYEITDYFNKFAQKNKVHYSKAREWFPLTFPWDLLAINEFLLKNTKAEVKGKVEKNCSIKGPVFADKGTIVKSGSYIEGPVWIGKNCEIGPNCFLRPFTSVGNNCRIGQAVEIKNAVISAGSKIAHLSYLADSIIGQNCNIGAGVSFANFRFDGKNIYSMIKGKLVDTGRKKFGAVLGNGAKVGVNASLMPGVLVGENAIIGPNSLIKGIVADGTVVYAKFPNIIKESGD